MSSDGGENLADLDALIDDGESFDIDASIDSEDTVATIDDSVALAASQEESHPPTSSNSEDDLIQAAIADSRVESHRQQVSAGSVPLAMLEEELMQAAIAASRVPLAMLEEELMQAAIAASRVESQQQQVSAGSVRLAMLEEELMQAALAASREESRPPTSRHLIQATIAASRVEPGAFRVGGVSTNDPALDSLSPLANLGTLQAALPEVPGPSSSGNSTKPNAGKPLTFTLRYDKEGWTRTIRVADMQSQWAHNDHKVAVDARFDAEKSAYVRKLELIAGNHACGKSACVRKLDFRAGTDARVRDGILTLVPADEGYCESRIKGADDQDLVTYADIAEAQVKNFEDKTAWFQDKCAMFCVEWDEGHMRMNVRRQYLLEDSVDAVMSLSRKDLRKLWRFEFIGEMGIDACGGLAREWFQLVTEKIFDPDMGLWMSSESNQMMMTINPASKLVCEDYLVYYRFLGRVMGKALFDGHLVAGHVAQYIYKHMLGWPVTFKDIEHLDEAYYKNLKKLKDMSDAGDDLSMLCLDFTTTQEVMGIKEEIELVEGGKDIDVDNDNFPEYLEACLRYRMIGQVKPQLNELLLGFFDVIPEPLLTIFDFQELELLMCGLPNIDMEDWKENTEYSGDYEHVGGNHPACIWYWEVVDEFDQEMRARLLQFVTGTSGVPSRGFGVVLRELTGKVRLFTIHGIPVGICRYPRAHTCFNRIDLPMYETKEELREKLKLAVTMVSTGFDIE